MPIFNGTENRDLIQRGEEGEGGELLDLTGDDVIYGYGGNDWLAGDRGKDIIYGGSGTDSLYGDEPDRGFADYGDAQFGGDDLIYGESGDDFVVAGVGRDIVDGGDGNDTLLGDGVYYIEGRYDSRYPLGSNDVIRGGAGNDRIEGGLGADTLYGGAGADTFVYEYFFKAAEFGYSEDIFDTGVGAANRDVIKDFEVGVDKISFEPSYNDLAITIDNYKPGWAMIKIDMDGDTKTDAQIQVYTGSAILTYDDILL
jgi:Ca2+-binding RTX toxin-like protein